MLHEARIFLQRVADPVKSKTNANRSTAARAYTYDQPNPPTNRAKQQMPQDYGFDAQEGVWRTSDMEVEIRSGCGVRMRIVGVDITPGRMVSDGHDDSCMDGGLLGSTATPCGKG